MQRAVEVETSEASMRAYRLWAYIHGLVSLELAGLAGSNETPTDRETTFIAALRSAASLIGEVITMTIFDLSHPIYQGMPIYPGDPQVEFDAALSIPTDGAEVTELNFGTTPVRI